jgi:SAM-dependent methyltransferase
VAKWNQEWCRKVHFEINDRIVFDIPQNRYRPEVESEDWFFSRMLNDLGLKIGATRKISVKHEGDVEFVNTHPWGLQAFDKESRDRKSSPVPNAFPLDVAGWLTHGEGQKLAELATGKRVLEIGSYCGLSTICMARTAKHVTAVDYFDGRATPSPRNTADEFRENLERYGVSEKVTAVHPTADLPLPEYDLAFVDGAHDYDSVAADAIRVRDVLAPNGLILFHDYKHPSHPGVEQAVDDILLDGGELISTHETLAVVRPPARIPLEV